MWCAYTWQHDKAWHAIHKSEETSNRVVTAAKYV